MKIQSLDSTVPYCQIYPGNSKFCCKGRIVMGNSRIMFTVSFSYLNLLALLQLSRLHPQNEVLIVCFAMLLLTDYFMIKTTFRDPGRIPRISSQFQNYPECYLIPQKQRFGVELSLVAIAKVCEIKFCDRCQIYKTQATAHCRRCDNCVEGFDHHCLWLGQCIGQRNYSTYYYFIWLLTLTLALFLSIQIQNLVMLDGVYLIEPIFYLVQTVVFLIFSLYLTFLHSYFIITNKTTYGYLTTNRFVVNHHNLLFYRGEGTLLIRKLTRMLFSIWSKIFRPNRAEIISFTQKIYCEVPGYIESMQMQQKLHFMVNNSTIEKMAVEDKSKTFQSERQSEKQYNQEKELPLDYRQDIDFKFLKIESESNQFSQESSHRGEKKDLKTFGMSQSQHIEVEFHPTNRKAIQKAIATGKHSKQYDNFEMWSNKKDELQILQIDQLG